MWSDWSAWRKRYWTRVGNPGRGFLTTEHKESADATDNNYV